MREILFSAGYYFSLVYSCKLFSLEISLQDIYIFFKSPITSSKVKLSAAKIHQTLSR